MYRKDFCMPSNTYLLNHSVGRPLKSAQSYCQSRFWSPWQTGASEPWSIWLEQITAFQQALARLTNHKATCFCPQVNISGALTKLLLSKPKWYEQPIKVLMSEADFPSIGFVFKHALPDADVVFIPLDSDMTDGDIWESYFRRNIDLAFVTHAFSNSGQASPLCDIAALGKRYNVPIILDVAQSLGVLELDLEKLEVDFVLGSSVKWLCGGPGAAFLWVSEGQINTCTPKDVGWFSHQAPFEFDIHQFDFASTALRFFGGTPSILPYTIATHSIEYFLRAGIDQVRARNFILLRELYDGLAEYVVSPTHRERGTGTAIFNFGQYQDAIKALCDHEGVAIDERQMGLRISPHIYNELADITVFIDIVREVIKGKSKF